MTTPIHHNPIDCPAEEAVKLLAGKWRVRILFLAMKGPVRFNSLIRQIDGANKQSVAVALKEMADSGLLMQTVVRQKPLHIEYTLTEKGQEMVDVFKTLPKEI